MGNYTQESYGVNRFWRNIAVIANGTYSIQTAVPGYRIVVEDILASGVNTGTTSNFLIRNVVTTTTVAFTGRMIATTGSTERDIVGTCIPMAASEGIELVVAGLSAGFLDITIVGRLVSNDTPLACIYTGAAL